MSILFLIVTVLLILLFRKSIKNTIYDYKNVLIFSGILFFAVLTALLLNTEIHLLACGAVFSVDQSLAVLMNFPRRFSFVAIFAIVCLSLAIFVSNIALIRHEGFRLHNLMGAVLGAGYVILTVVVYYLIDVVLKDVLESDALFSNGILYSLRVFVPLFFVTMICYLDCILIATCVMGYIAAKHVPKHDKDFIIILGCRIDKKGGLLPLIKERTNRALRFGWEQEMENGKRITYVPSGGQGPDEIMSEGAAMEMYLLSRSVEQYEIFSERRSKNTWENMLFSGKMIKEYCEKQAETVRESTETGLDAKGVKIAFATTNYHIFRSGIYAVKAGLEPEGIASRTKWYFWPNGFIREYVALLAMEWKTHVRMTALIAGVCIAFGVFTTFFV